MDTQYNLRNIRRESTVRNIKKKKNTAEKVDSRSFEPISPMVHKFDRIAYFSTFFILLSELLFTLFLYLTIYVFITQCISPSISLFIPPSVFPYILLLYTSTQQLSDDQTVIDTAFP
jgi:hypothetical protein